MLVPIKQEGSFYTPCMTHVGDVIHRGPTHVPRDGVANTGNECIELVCQTIVDLHGEQVVWGRQGAGKR